jgi:hypothetical protein
VFRRTVIASILSCTFALTWAQEGLITENSLLRRQQEIREMRPDEGHRIAVEYARMNRLPERIVYRDGTVMEIRKLSPAGRPMYYRTFNINAARTISTDKVWKGGSAGLELDGSGIVIGVWDGGAVRISHDEFGGRARILDGTTEIISHSTHVAGTAIAAGVLNGGSAHGMAGRSTLDSHDWNNDNEEMDLAAGNGLLISNHSYGFIHGWNYDTDQERWEWWGDPELSEREDYNFGFYGEDAEAWDVIAVKHPRYLIVKSAGNDRGEGPAPGAPHYVFTNGAWRESTVVRDLDGGVDGFDCISTQGTSKNILTIGAVDDMRQGYTGPDDVELGDFSAFGPTDDGRIKPDLVANGIALYSSTSETDQSLGFSSGTSMSAPSVAGSLALLQQHYWQLKGKYMYASQLKALVLHTADEAGNDGPDYKYGWGLMNTASAAAVISSVPADRFFYDTLSNKEVQEFPFFCDGTGKARITIVWADPPGTVKAPQLDPQDRKLVNDLDIRLIRTIDGHEYSPFVLDPANPSKQAQAGDNVLDNVEQIRVGEPMAGFYTLRVSHKQSLSGGMQAYGMVVTGLHKEYIASGYNELEDANGSILLTSAGQYLNNMDVQWLITPGNGQPVSLYFDFFETEESGDFLTVYDGGDTTAPVIAVFSGELGATDTLLTASSDQMFITFTSDGQGTAPGFLGRYCTVAPEGSFSIDGEPYPCAQSVSSYFALGQEGAYYTWTSEPVWDIQERSVNGIDVAIGEGPGTLSVVPYNRCGSAGESSLALQALSSTPLLEGIRGDTLPCLGSQAVLTTDALPGVTYLWELPADWAGASDSDSLFYVPGSGSGSVSVTGQNACGKGNMLSREVTVLDVPPRPSIQTEKVPPCAYAVQDFYIANGAGGEQYMWEVNDDWSILGPDDRDTVTIQVGAQESFLFLTTINKCGETGGNRLFLTSPLPPDANVIRYDGVLGLPELQVTNMNNFKSILWYRDGEALQGEAAGKNPLVVNLNGRYRVETISEQGCRNDPGGAGEIVVAEGRLEFLVYRMSETSICIENTSLKAAAFRIFDLQGRVVMTGEAVPGFNEVPFLGNGIFLVNFPDSGSRKYKVFF